MRLATQPEHQWCVHSGPLVLGAAPTNSPTPTADRDRTVSRRSKPSSRTTLNGEQPYPWDLLQMCIRDRINYAISLSDFLEKVLKKHPHFLAQWWQTPPQFSNCQHYASRLADQLSTIQNEEQLYKTLRNFRNQEMAKLSFCQSLNLATVEEIFIRLSQLAESLIIGARDWPVSYTHLFLSREN